MSTPIIIGLVALLLAILVGVAVTLQTIEKNNREKRRLEASLKARARNFQHLLEGFPKGFLNRDLQLLICKCLKEIYSQLIKTNPKNSIYLKNKTVFEQLIETTKAQSSNEQNVSLDNNEQIKEIQKLLQSLYGYIGILNKNRSLSNDEANTYGQQVKALMMKTSLDALNNAVNHAISQNKPRLAIHYYHMIINRYEKENANGHYNQQIEHYKAEIDKMESEVTAQKQRRQEADEEWDKALSEEDGSWKKNAVYD